MLEILRDLRIATRSLRQRPLFVVTASLTLALGVGAAAAVFSVVEATLLQPLPFRDADRLAVVWGVAGPERDIRGASPIEIRDWDEAVDALGPLARYNDTRVNLSGEGEARQLEAELVGVHFFRILGVSPVLGRDFVVEDDEPGAAGAAIISHDLWQRRWGGAPDVIGQTVLLDGVAFAVAGVMPEGFTGMSFDTEIWVPLGPFVTPEAMADRGGRYLAAVGRLAPDATPGQAQEQLAAAARALEEQHPVDNRERGAMLVPLRDFYVGPVRPLLLMVLGGVGLLLLIACANVASLQLVRGIERRREVSLRYAMGAGRGSVARQLLIESLVLAAVGGAAGVAVAWAALQLLLPMVPAGALPAFAEPRMDAPLLAISLGTALLAGTLTALVPALRAGRQDPAGALRGESRGIAAGGWGARRIGSQQAIIVAEVAMVLVLLVAAGLAVRSLRAQLALEPGYDATGVLAARVSLSGDQYDPSRRAAFAEGLVEELRGLTGVDGVAAISAAPLRGYTSATYIFRAEDVMTPENRIRFYRHSLTPRAFDVLGIPIVQGRGFTAADRDETTGVVVVSEAFAAKVWPGQDAVGRRLLLGPDTATVVGVAGNVRFRTLTTDLMDPGEDPDVYFAYAQVPTTSFDVVVRSTSDPAAFTAPIRAAVAGRDSSRPLFDVATLGEVLAGQTALGRTVSAFLAVFGILALLVAAVGLYGLLAFAVQRRRREIAIRAAIGAGPSALLRMVVGQGLGLVAMGLALGLLGALGAGRVAASALYGVRAADPLVLAATAAVLLAVASVASYVPARHALRVDPRTAMADE